MLDLRSINPNVLADVRSYLEADRDDSTGLDEFIESLSWASFLQIYFEYHGVDDIVEDALEAIEEVCRADDGCGIDSDEVSVQGWADQVPTSWLPEERARRTARALVK